MDGGIFPLELFPQGPLQSSVIVTVFIGVLVMTFFTETYGWVFSGIVVPGYLVPIIFVAPYSAGVIAVEAILTYLVVEFLSDYLPKRQGYWAPMFGRDKFLCIIFISVGVRLVLELFALPAFGLWIQTWSPDFDYRNKFTGIGLVVVPLLANMIWKPGLIRGFGHAAISIFVTFVIVKYLLIPFTNFSIVRFHFLYEAVALDFAASPKTYIIILMGVLIAAQLNLYLGWDFNGVMVPTLLALAWLTPLSLATTIGEGIVVLILAKGIVKLPVLRTMTMEGPRLLCLLFTIGFLEKLLVGHLCSAFWPEFPYEHLFGYGYMLSALVALKMWQKKIFTRLALPIAKVSLASLAFGVFLGWTCLSVIDPAVWFQAQGASKTPGQRLQRIEEAPYEVVVQDLTLQLRPGGQAQLAKMMPSEEHAFQAVIGELNEASRETKLGERVQRAAQQANSIGMEVVLLEDKTRDARYLYLRESPGIVPRRGWGMALFRVGARSRLVIEAPRPVSEPRTAEAALVLLELTHAHAVLIPGAHFRTNADGTSDPLRWSRVPFRLAHFRLRTHDVLEVRALPIGEVSTFWAESVLPEEVRVRALQDWLGNVELAMPPQPPPVENAALRGQVRASYCTLALAPLAARSLLAARYSERARRSSVAGQPLSISVGHVVSLIQRRIEEMQEIRDFVRRIPDRSELLYVDQQILTPLVDAAVQDLERSRSAKERLDALTISIPPIIQAAKQIGYRVELVQHRTGEYFVVLSEQKTPLRGWGTYAVRIGPCRALHLLAPYPVTEVQSASAAINLFAATRARALSISTVGPPQAATKGLDAQARFESVSLYQLFHQVVQRRLWTRENVLSVEIRGAGKWPEDVKAAGILKEGNLLGGARAVSSEVMEFHDLLGQMGLPISLHTGGEGLLGFGLADNPQLRYSLNLGAGPYAALWFSREARLGFQDVELSAPREHMLQTLGIPIQVVSAGEWLTRAPSRTSIVFPAADPWDRFRLAVAEALAYVEDENVVRIERLIDECKEKNLSLVLIKEVDRGLPFLAIEADYFPNRHVCALVNLSPMSSQKMTADLSEPMAAARIFVDQRPSLMVFGMPLP